MKPENLKARMAVLWDVLGPNHARIAKALNTEGVLNESNSQWSERDVADWYEQNPDTELRPLGNLLFQELRAKLSIPMGELVKRQVSEHVRGQMSRHVRDQVRKELSLIIDSLPELIRKEFKTMLPEASFSDLAQDSPPTRPKKSKGRGYAGEKRVMPGCNVDKVIFDLFENFRRRQGLSASAAMELLLWQALGKPKLSYQEETSTK